MKHNPRLLVTQGVSQRHLAGKKKKKKISGITGGCTTDLNALHQLTCYPRDYQFPPHNRPSWIDRPPENWYQMVTCAALSSNWRVWHKCFADPSWLVLLVSSCWLLSSSVHTLRLCGHNALKLLLSVTLITIGQGTYRLLMIAAL